MPGVVPRQQHGPDTLEVSENVNGGQLVVPSTGGKVKPAGAGAINVLGVALDDARPAGSAPTNPINTAWPHSEVAVAYGVDIRVTYNAAAKFGDLLVTAAGGQVAPVDETATFDQIVGRCTEPGGVSAGAVGRARIA
ncbi:hypothetical protein [Saccharopolyspora sp. NPDC002376]